MISTLPTGGQRLNRFRSLALTLGTLMLIAACGGPTVSFDPSGGCGADGRAAGAYPDLEARLPQAFDGRVPSAIDSGRHCSADALGSLVAHDTTGVQFAGATWDLGSGTGVSSVVFSLPERDLPAAWIAEFYEVGARTAKRTDNIEASRPTYEGAGETWRLDTLNGLSLQTVVTWQDGPMARV
ncbi:MAG: hypothetical protein HW391_956, partial [Chloroflexi bacterium]|nr:hypothetical protein [Chloroflexota bacterium]